MQELKYEIADNIFLVCDDYDFHPGEMPKVHGHPDSQHDGAPAEFEVKHGYLMIGDEVIRKSCESKAVDEYLCECADQFQEIADRNHYGRDDEYEKGSIMDIMENMRELADNITGVKHA